MLESCCYADREDTSGKSCGKTCGTMILRGRAVLQRRVRIQSMDRALAPALMTATHLEFAISSKEFAEVAENYPRQILPLRFALESEIMARGFDRQ
jgi:hypothetical protein